MFETVESFQEKIYSIQSNTSESLIDTICLYCESNRIEVESVGEFITGKLMNDLRIEYEKLNFLPKTNRIDMEIF